LKNKRQAEKDAISAEEKKKQEMAAELEKQKQARKLKGLEESEQLKMDVVNAKINKQQQDKERKEREKLRKVRFDYSALSEEDKVLADEFSKLVDNEFPKPNIKSFEKKFEEEKVGNTTYALMVIVRKLLHNAPDEANMQTFMDYWTPTLTLVCKRGNVAMEELLYAAARIVANEMRNDKKQLPDYSKETSVIESFFWELYERQVLTEEQVLKWFNDEGDETPGRADVYFQLTAFYNFLTFVEESSEEEDDEDEEEVQPLNSGIEGASRQY